MTDKRIAKWTRWIEGPIKDDVLSMHLRRFAWGRLGEIIKAHGQLPDSYFWEYLTQTYAHTQAVAVRRQAVPNRESANLGQLIYKVAEDPTPLTRDFWLGLQDNSDPWDLRFAEQQWAEEYGGEVGDHLDPAIAAADLERLTRAAADVKRYVDENIAHSDVSPAEDVITFDDMHTAIDAIGEPFTRYCGLLTAKGWGDLTPVIQYDWEAIFREPWIPQADRSGG